MEDTIQWKEFRIIDLFFVEKGRGKNQKDLKQGNTPYVSATNLNNGIVAYSDDQPNYKDNCITVSDFGVAHFQEKPFTGTHIVVLTPKFNINKEIGIFISICITNSIQLKYSFGYAVSASRFSKEKILLPYKNGIPDYTYMQSYIKKISEQQKQSYRMFMNKELDKIQYKKIDDLNNKEWKSFSIEDIFDIFPGKRLEKRNMNMGKTPFIGATDSNNGITNFVSNENKTLDNNVLGVNYNGSVVENFYHKYNCIFSDDVKRFHLKEYSDNEFVLLFFKTVILMQKNKYRYGYKFNEERMKRQKIMVPVDQDGFPDYLYMEQFIKNIKYEQMKDCLNAEF